MLRVTDVNASYGESHILRDVSLTVRHGECVALLGRNGAGKTTTLKAILGLVRASSGTVSIDGVDVSKKQAFRIVRLGVGYVPEHRGIFAALTVLEHLKLAVTASRNNHGPHTIDSVLALFPRVKSKLANHGSELSGGEQQMLAIARALLTNPKLLILDEPSEGLAPAIVDFLEDRLLEIKASGIPILVVEQNYYLATALADRVYVLSQGEVKFEGSPAALEDNSALKKTYLSV